jgi:hypothetical protein
VLPIPTHGHTRPGFWAILPWFLLFVAHLAILQARAI